jgi:hypothetical protein
MPHAQVTKITHGDERARRWTVTPRWHGWVDRVGLAKLPLAELWQQPEVAMTALARSDERTVLLLLPSRNEMYPLNTAAFTRAQASRKELASGYRDALILDRDGSLRKIERVDVLGPWGDSIGRKLLSRLTDAWSVDVRLSDPLPHSLEQIKQLVISCTASPKSVDAMQFGGATAQRQFTASVRVASSVGELLSLLKLPMPEDALDVL